MLALATVSLVALLPTANLPSSPQTSSNLAFVENRGQWDGQAKFRASVPGLDLWVTDDGVVLDYNTTVRTRRTGHVVRVRFSGTQPGSALGSKKLSGRVNYLVGERSRWTTDIPTYQEAWVQGVSDGI
ncbi:MAG TPA: hypothetical protein VGE01_00385, partial [Fimbriimonas sp.]